MKKLILIICFVLAALETATGQEEKQWIRPGGDPFWVDLIRSDDSLRMDAINSLWIPPDEIKQGWMEEVMTEQYKVGWVRKGTTLPELNFGGKKSKKVKHWGKTTCAWQGVDSLAAKFWNTIYRDSSETEDKDTITYYEGIWTLVQFDTCSNLTWLFEGSKTVVPRKKSEPEVRKEKPKLVEEPAAPPLLATVKKRPLSISWITEVSHWNNDQNPWIDYGEAKIGLRFTLRSQRQWLPTFETDFWLGTRLHTVSNGEQRAWQGLLYQVQPKFSLQPADWLFFLGADALTLNNRGLDSNTILALGQIYLNPLRVGHFEPMFQVSGSMTDSWPRFLGNDEFPESRARYQEIKGRLQLFRFGNLRLGWEDTWFTFEKTMVDSNLALNNQLQYQSVARPAIGGPYVQFKFPWEIYADFSAVREHIDSEVYVIQEEEIGSWIPGEINEWRFNLVLSRGFRLDLLR